VKEKGKVVYRYLKGSYLCIFDRPVKWETNVKIMNWVALESGNVNLQRYVRMQCIKQTSTVRISRKEKKPIPKVAFRFGTQDRQIKKFLETRKFVLDSLKRLKGKEGLPRHSARLIHTVNLSTCTGFHKVFNN
jgi:hypothetical protein